MKHDTARHIALAVSAKSKTEKPRAEMNELSSIGAVSASMLFVAKIDPVCCMNN